MPALVPAPRVAASKGLLALWTAMLVWFVTTSFGFLPAAWMTKLARTPIAYATIDLAFLVVELALLFRFAAGRRGGPAAWPAWTALVLAAIPLPRAVGWVAGAMGGVLLSGQGKTLASVLLSAGFQISFWLALTRSTTTPRGLSVLFYAVLVLKKLPFFLGADRADAVLLAPLLQALTIAGYLLPIFVLRNLVAGRRLISPRVSPRLPTEPAGAPSDPATDAMGIALGVGLPLVSLVVYGVAHLFPLRGNSPWFVPTVFAFVLSAVGLGTSWAMRFGSRWKAALPSLAAALVLPYEYFWVSIAPVKASPRASGLWNGAFYQAAFFSLALGVAIVAVVTTVVVVNLLRLRTPVPSDGDRALHAQRARSMVVIASEACSAPKVSIS